MKYCNYSSNIKVVNIGKWWLALAVEEGVSCLDVKRNEAISGLKDMLRRNERVRNIRRNI